MTDITAEQLLQRALATVGWYRMVKRITVYGRPSEDQILWEGFADDFPQTPPSSRRVPGGFICGDFEMSPPWFEKMEPDGTWRSCPDPRPFAVNSNRKRR